MKKLLTMIGVAAAVAVGTALDAIATELVTNGGFDECEGTAPSEYAGISATLTLPGWTKGGNVGITKSYSGCPWLRVGTLNGDYAMFFQKIASITQTIDVVEAGTYVASFGYIARADNVCYAKGRFYVEIDGVEIGHADCGTERSKFRLARFTTNLSVGSHLFVIRHTNELSTDGEKRSNSILDAVSLQSATDVATGNLLSNGSFENHTGFPYTSKECGFADNISIEGWTMDAPNGRGLAKAGSNYIPYSPVDGDFGLYFNNENEISVSQPISVPAAGDYVVSFAYAARDSRYYYGGRIYAQVDGESMGYVDCTAVARFRRAMFRTHLTAGDHSFTLRHTTEADTEVGHVPCSAVDDVSIRPIDTLIMNGDFDSGTVSSDNNYSGATAGEYSNPGWTVSGNAGLAKPGYPGTAWVSSQLDGTGVYSMFIQTANYSYGGTTRTTDAASIQQTFDVTKPGVYELRFSYAARPYNNYKGGQIFARIYKGEGLEGELMWERFVIANSLTSFDEFVGNVKLYDPGKYTLQFYAPQPEYSTTAANERDSVIDNVSLRFHHKIMGFIISFY